MGDKDRGVIKEVMKKGKARLMERQLAWGRVTQWQARLEALEPGVQQLLQVGRCCSTLLLTHGHRDQRWCWHVLFGLCC